MPKFSQKLTSSQIAQSGIREQNRTYVQTLTEKGKGNQSMQRQTLTAITILKPVSWMYTLPFTEKTNKSRGQGRTGLRVKAGRIRMASRIFGDCKAIILQ